MQTMPHHAAIVALALFAQASATPSAQSSWLDRPIAKWQSAGAAMPSPPATPEPKSALAARCASIVATGSPADALLEKAGWVPFLHVDRRHTRDDVEVVGGMAAATAACEPATFNLFVFVGGQFAGTLSPSSMYAARDGAAGSVRLTGQDALTTEFARYTAADAECCPSSIVRVTYRVNRQSSVPVLEALEARRVR
jgi:hypothetical protein